eukprot:TRINITY_DN12276_c0_g1_i1.p1 TRINITY_DN12276_c0_g1~~TRINITY_DN12276_c0_g1_i1.p1  ORF type:complete len:320 (-),score=45.16 TRINITY_DN12276_c0_g1_i1:55-1014(-)
MDAGAMEPDAQYEVFKFKIQCFFVIMATGLVGGLLPIRLRVKDRLLSFGNILSGGFFLAAGFTHMLAEAVEGFEKLEITFMGRELPFAYLLCMLGLLGTFFIERVVMGGHKHTHSPIDFMEEANSNSGHSHAHSHQSQQEAELSRGIKKESQPDDASRSNMYMLAVLLSLHSLIEGIALGVEDTMEDTTKVLLAIVGHKIFDAFALGISLVKNNIQSSQLIKLVCLFSLTTPIGIALGITFLPNPNQNLLAEVVKGISSGTFIYIALIEVILEEFENPKDRYLKFLLLLVGAFAMTILSSHGHEHGVHEHVEVQHSHSH